MDSKREGEHYENEPQHCKQPERKGPGACT